jgi:hypothetical protein
MNKNTTGSFFARIRQKFFKWRIDREIFDRIFPHHRGEKDHGYSFDTREQMNAQTEELNVQPLLDDIEKHIHNMPDAYGESFRYIMYRELHERFRMYEQLARRRVRRSCDSRFVATRLEPAH